MGKRAIDYARLNDKLKGTDVLERLEAINMADAKFVELCQKGTAQEVRAALDAGANATASGKVTVDIGGRSLEIEATALMAASFKNSPEVIKILVNTGADVHAKDKYGMTALMLAAKYNPNPEVLNGLLKAGADVNAKDNASMTALMAAAENNPNLEIINALLKAGADVNAKGMNDLTALMRAVRNNSNPEIINILLKAGADVHAKDEGGKRAVDYARKNEKLKGTDALKRLEELSK